MATYNGEKYIKEQLQSILPQISEGDEIIICDDGSTDSTLEIVRELTVMYNVRILENNFKSVIKNFESGLKIAKNEVIFLSDQDDVWRKDKISLMVKEFEISRANLVICDRQFTDYKLMPIDRLELKYRKGYSKNLYKNSYTGCCMAFDKNLLKLVLPFPDKIPMHDSWIGLMAEATNMRISFIDEKLIYYRRHASTVTKSSRNKYSQIISGRVHLRNEVKKRIKHVKIGR